MALVELLLARICEPTTWVALVLGAFTAYVLNFYYRVRQLPKGPAPIPFLGNILQLRKPRPLAEKAIDWLHKYGDPITIWLGTRPFIVASTKESFKEISGPLRNLVADRPQLLLNDLQSRGFDDVVVSNFTPAWDVLRRVTHVALRKYAQTEKLANLVANTVDSELKDLFGGAKEKQTEIVEYVGGVVSNTLAISTFGEGFQKGGKDYEDFQTATKVFEEEAANGLPSDILPILRWVYFRQEKKARQAIDDFLGVSDRMFEQAKNTWTKGQARHFTDVLLNAREEFIAEDRGSAKYLHNDNLKNAVSDIFGAGTGTSKSILSYCFLRLANDPELQEELRAEINYELGSRVCTLEDRARLPKVDSFLQEIIRFYPPVPLAVGRRTQTDVTMNGRFIPKGTDLFYNIFAVNRDKTIWGPDAEEFVPDRFIKVKKEQLTNGANSFGIGARSCPGEKMAQADMLYAIVRTLQNVKLSCIDGPGTADLENINSDIFIDAKRQDLIFTKLGA